MPNKNLTKIIIGAVALIVLVFFSGRLIENVEAGEIVVIQYPTGTLKVVIAPGPTFQLGGSATHYPKSFQYWFNKIINSSGDTIDSSIKMRFNDGGHGNLLGSVRIDMPLDEPSILLLHTKFGSIEAIQSALIGTVIQKSVYMTGPMMSSKESYAEKRNDLISLVEDQAINGVYKTQPINVRIKDPIDTTQTKMVASVEIVKDKNGVPLRQEKSPMIQFNIHLYNLSINGLDYDGVVEKQIQTQQQAAMSIQTAMANAKRAEQDAYTAEQQGKANAAKAKWEQETIKAAATTEAEKIRDVARLTADAEEQNKRANILKGQGEAEYKRLVTQANNNLELKLDAWVKVNQYYAEAMSQSNWVPTYISGGGYNGANYSTGAMDLINMMSAKTAQDWGLQIGPGQAAPTTKSKK